MQIRIPVRYHFTPVKVAKIGKTDNNTFWKGCKNWSPHTLYMECKIVQTLRRKQNAQHKLSCDPAIPILDIDPREMKIYVNAESYKWMFIAALST